MEAFYRLVRPEIAWGDYGNVLAHGIASRTSFPDGTLNLERTGPFVPPISQPRGCIIVTDAFRRELEGSHLNGFSFQGVIKKRITAVDWRAWQPYGSEEIKYPAGGEPEGYILGRKHSPLASDAIGEVWEMRFNAGIQASRDGGYHLIASSWNRTDFFMAEGGRPLYHFVSQGARDWLEARVAEWVAFEAVRTSAD